MLHKLCPDAQVARERSFSQIYLKARDEVHARARTNHPARCSNAVQNLTPIEVVTLNPERDSVLETFTKIIDKRSAAA